MYAETMKVIRKYDNGFKERDSQDIFNIAQDLVFQDFSSGQSDSKLALLAEYLLKLEKRIK